MCKILGTIMSISIMNRMHLYSKKFNYVSTKICPEVILTRGALHYGSVHYFCSN